jgi:hypothetical protein
MKLILLCAVGEAAVVLLLAGESFSTLHSFILQADFSQFGQLGPQSSGLVD